MIQVMFPVKVPLPGVLSREAFFTDSAQELVPARPSYLGLFPLCIPAHVEQKRCNSQQARTDDLTFAYASMKNLEVPIEVMLTLRMLQ